MQFPPLNICENYISKTLKLWPKDKYFLHLVILLYKLQKSHEKTARVRISSTSFLSSLKCLARGAMCLRDRADTRYMEAIVLDAAVPGFIPDPQLFTAYIPLSPSALLPIKLFMNKTH